MWRFFSRRLLGVALGTVLAACGSDLTLPDDGSPPPDDTSPASLLVFSGDGQQARVGRRLDDPLVVRVTNASSLPVRGVPVTFQFQGSAPDAEVDPTVATTDEDGKAESKVRLGSTPGSHIVEARVVEPTAADLRATFAVIALAGGGGGGDDDD